MNESPRYPESLEQLIGMLKMLPGVGRRGAERLTLALLKWTPEKQQFLGKLIAGLETSVGVCPECGGMAEAGELCPICKKPGRERSVVCVVESPSQIFAIESGGNYRGRYHVLGGRLSPLDHENGESLRIEPLLALARSGEVQEVILALSPDVEGRATAIFLAGLLREYPVKITRPAQGLPAGANLAYADGATIAAAFSGRTSLD